MLIGSRTHRKRLGDRIVDTVTRRVTGGVNLLVPANAQMAEALTGSSDIGSFPQNQTVNFDIIAVCGIAICGDGTKAGP